MSDKVKSAFVVTQSETTAIPEKLWATVPEGVVRALQVNGQDAVKFVGHAHFGGLMRSVFEMLTEETINKPSLDFIKDKLAPIGTVKHPSQKEYDIACRCQAAPNPKEIS